MSLTGHFESNQMTEKRSLTKADLSKINQRGMHSLGDGLYLRVYDGGRKSFVARIYENGARKDVTLSDLSKLSVAEARRKTKALRSGKVAAEKVAEPAMARAPKQKSDAPTFEWCANEYMDGHQSAWTEKHHLNWRQSLRDFAFPIIGKLPVDQIDVDAVLKCVRPIWEVKTETAARVLSRIRIVLGWAKARKYRTGDNPAAWTDNMSHILPDRDKVVPVKHHAALPFKEIPAFIAKLVKCDDFAAPCLLFTILTAARSGEARGAVWSEINFDECEWIIPASRMKAGKEHRVPMSPQASRIVAELDDGKRKPGELVFKSIRKGAACGGAISHVSFARVFKACGYDGITTHGFRSSFRDWAAETTDHANEVVELALAHAIGSKVEAAYRRGNLLQKRRALMDDWAIYCFGGKE